jgi:hypothetical protein
MQAQVPGSIREKNRAGFRKLKVPETRANSAGTNRGEAASKLLPETVVAAAAV